MNTFHEDVRALIGEELRVIGATHIQDSRSGIGMDEKEVCFFSVSNKIIAISYSPRDGATCFIGDAESPEFSQYETWNVLWRVLGMDKNLDFDIPETVTEYLDKFPKGYDGLIKFIGTCLVKHFGAIG